MSIMNSVDCLRQVLVYAVVVINSLHVTVEASVYSALLQGCSSVSLP